MISAQGGDPSAPLPVAPVTEVVRAERAGVVSRLDAYGVGVAAWRLGAGRARKEDAVSKSAGVLLHRREGDRVAAGDPILELRTEDAARIPAALEALSGALLVDEIAAPTRKLLLDRIGV
jgi:thymidine phosphorylase